MISRLFCTVILISLAAASVVKSTEGNSSISFDPLIGKRLFIWTTDIDRSKTRGDGWVSLIGWDVILVGRSNESLRVQSVHDTATFVTHVDSIKEVQLFRGTYSHTNTGALVGLGLGGLFAYAAWQSSEGPEQGDKHDLRKTVAVMSVAGGLLAGIGVGSLIKSERWEEIPIASLKVKPSLGFTGNGLRLQLSLRF